MQRICNDVRHVFDMPWIIEWNQGADDRYRRTSAVVGKGFVLLKGQQA